MAPYPAQREVDIALRDGTTLHVRPVRPDDELRLRDFLERLSPEDRVMRFFSAGTNVAAAARDAADVDYEDRYGIVAVGGDGETVLAHGCFVRTSGREAEVAFAVDGSLRGEGVATAMLAHLADAAREAGIDRITAVVLPQNRAMLDVFRESGLHPEVRVDHGDVQVSMPVVMDAEAWERYDRRDAEAARAAVSHVLRPSSVAVVGASDRPGSVGGAVLRNLIDAGFTGRIHPVNRRGGTIAGLPAARTPQEIGEPIELGVIVIPAAGVAQAAEDCAQAGARALVVISDGFAEAGPEGRRRQDELLAVCRRHGMRLVGPNCLGVMCTDPDVRLNAAFAPGRPIPGSIAFLSQSGALGIAAIDLAQELGLGLSAFVSVGNKADLSGNDFLSYWEVDERTNVILLYLESFGNPRKFSRVARRVARTTPIVAVKGGRSPAGQRAAGSHTGAMLAGSTATVDALFEQAGVIRTESLSELFDVAALLSVQSAPSGTRIGIITNGGGLGILCADACAANGLDVAGFDDGLRRRLAQRLPDGAAVGNPVDLLAAAPPEAFERAIVDVGASGAVDAIVAIYVPPMVSDPVEVARAIGRAAVATDVPVASVFSMADAPLEVLHQAAEAVPVYRFPENAARALSRAARYGAWLARPPEPPPTVEADVEAARTVIGDALDSGGGWLDPGEVATLLDAYGIPRPRQRVVKSARAAAAAAVELGGPVALKAIAPGLVHRSDAGAVATGLTGATAVTRAARAMRRRLLAAGFEPKGYVVQEMADPGVELLAGVVADPIFGPVLLCAAGGTTAEILGDSTVRLTPLSRRDAAEMLRELRTFPLLDGFRGAPRCDVAAVEEVLVRLAAMAEAHPAIAEIEGNPVIVGPDGACVVDARVRVHQPAPRRPEPAVGPPGG
jgi:acetyl coenzyme A synthetase (ADP forming)-like protein